MTFFLKTLEFEYEVIECASCAIPFALSFRFIALRREDKGNFYCPLGHINVYRTSTSDKLKRELEAAKQEADRLAQRVLRESDERVRVQKSFTKLLTRIANGVCPCCNRNFEHLARHMKTQHPEFAFDEPNQQLKFLRALLCLTQQQVAEEVGFSASVVSQFESGHKLSEQTNQGFLNWLARNRGKQPVVVDNAS